MTDKELTTMAHEECQKLLKSKKGYHGISFQEFWAEGYIKGFAEGRKDTLSKFENGIIRITDSEGKPKWHDLRKDPNDLPKEGIEVLVLFSNTFDDNGLVLNKHTLRYELAQYINDEEDLTEWYWVESGLDDMVHEVIAWCELPKFEG